MKLTEYKIEVWTPIGLIEWRRKSKFFKAINARVTLCSCIQGPWGREVIVICSLRTKLYLKEMLWKLYWILFLYQNYRDKLGQILDVFVTKNFTIYSSINSNYCSTFFQLQIFCNPVGSELITEFSACWWAERQSVLCYILYCENMSLLFIEWDYEYV